MNCPLLLAFSFSFHLFILQTVIISFPLQYTIRSTIVICITVSPPIIRSCFDSLCYRIYIRGVPYTVRSYNYCIPFYTFLF